MASILDDVLLHSQETGALEAAHALLRTISSEQSYFQELGSMHSLLSLLNELGFSGLWRASNHTSTEDVKGDCFELTEKLIEVSLSS